MKAATIGLAAAAALSGCASVPLVTARDDIHRFFVAVRDEDQPTFDALVRQDGLAGSIVLYPCYEAGHRRGELLRCIDAQPKPTAVPLRAFRGIAASYGYAPGRTASGPVRLPLDSMTFDHICVREKSFGKCLLYFSDRGMVGA